MSYQTIASGDNSNFLTLPQYDDDFNEGEKGLLQLSFVTSISSTILSSIQQEMINRGVQGAKVTQSGSTVKIYFQKGMPALVIIIPILLALIVALAIILVSWHIFKEVVPEGLQGAVGTGLIVAVIAVVALIVKKRLEG